MPSKESIREIRINQNPFSPEFDKLGYGRIEIFTKPGTDKFHGTGFYNFGDSFWNTRNPYAQQKAPFLLKEYGGNLSGPINITKAAPPSIASIENRYRNSSVSNDSGDGHFKPLECEARNRVAIIVPYLNSELREKPR